MNKIAGELTPTAFHVSARTVAAHALSIFGDHSDVMFCRTTGFAMLSSNSVQEAMDWRWSRMPRLSKPDSFLHFFDGFRTSHEVNKIEMLTEDDMRALITWIASPSIASARYLPTIQCYAARHRIRCLFSSA